MFSAMFMQSGVDLAAAEDHAVNLCWGCDVIGFVGWVRDDPLEMGVTGEVFDGRSGERMAKKRFREE